MAATKTFKAKKLVLSKLESTLLSSDLQPFALLDNECRFHSINESFSKCFKQSQHQLIGKTLSTLTNGVDDQLELLLSKLQSNEIPSFEYSIQCHEFKVNLQIVNTSSTNEYNKAAVFAKSEINENLYTEQHFRSIYEQSPMGIVMDAPNNGIIANPRFCELLGYSKEELLSKSIKDISHPEDSKKHLPLMKKLMSKELDVVNLEKRYIKKNGEICWANVTISPVFDEAGNVFNHIACVECITEKRNIQAELDKSEQKYLRFFENNQQGILTLDANFIVTDANASICNILGYNSREEFMGRSMLSITLDGDHINCISLMQMLQNKEVETFSTEKPLCKKDGTLIDATMVVNGFYNEEEQLKHVIISISDITEKKRTEQELKTKFTEIDEKNKQLKRYIESNMQLENFAYIASHDMKEPLRTIGNFSQLLAKRLDGQLDQTSNEFLKFISDGVKNMNHLINDLLTYSRVNSQDHKLEQLNVEDQLFVIIRSLDSTIDEMNANIKINDIPKTILGNATKIKQLFQNLIANAIKFRRAGVAPNVYISGEEKEDFWQFEIKDNGIGINPDFHQKVFQLFKKLHGKQEYSGTGIGLALCKKIVEQHGGEIWLESKENEGTSFFFTINKNAENHHQSLSL